MEENSPTQDFIELRDDLSTALKESINFRLHNSDYTHHQLFEEIGNIDELIDVQTLFQEDDVTELDIFDRPTDTNEVERQLIETLDSPDAFVEDNDSNDSKAAPLDDYLFDVED